MNTMTTIMEKPMVSGGGKTPNNQTTSGDALTFKKFLGEATKGKQESKTLENQSSGKEECVKPKVNEEAMGKDTQDAEKAVDSEKDPMITSVQMLHYIPVSIEVPHEESLALEIPSSSLVIMEDVSKEESLSANNVIQPEFVDISTPKKAIDFSNVEAKTTEINPSEMKSLENPRNTIVTENLNQSAERKIPEEALNPVMNEVVSDKPETLMKNLNIKKFKEESINADIKESGLNTSKVKSESNPWEEADLKKESILAKNEGPDLQKLILEKLQPKIQDVEEGEMDKVEEVENKDTRFRNHMPPATSLLRPDFKIEAKNPQIAETFQKNLDIATEEIMTRVTTLKEGGDSTMTLKLHPEDLGEIEISLHLSDGKVSGKILTDHKDLRDLFLKNMEELTHTLKENKVNVLKFEVGGFNQNSFSEGRQEENRRLLQTKGIRAYGTAETKIAQDMPTVNKNTKDGLNILA